MSNRSNSGNRTRLGHLDRSRWLQQEAQSLSAGRAASGSLLFGLLLASPPPVGSLFGFGGGLHGVGDDRSIVEAALLFSQESVRNPAWDGSSGRSPAPPIPNRGQ